MCGSLESGSCVYLTVYMCGACALACVQEYAHTYGGQGFHPFRLFKSPLFCEYERLMHVYV